MCKENERNVVVTMSKQREFPEMLYKYCSLSKDETLETFLSELVNCGEDSLDKSFRAFIEYSRKKTSYSRTLQIINECKLRFSSPIKFNDPFDCRINPKRATLEEMIDFLNRKLPQDTEVDETLFREDFSPERLNKILHDGITAAIKEHGVCSMTTKKDNILMWSHYADQHRGICLGFYTGGDSDLFGSAFEVSYNPNYPLRSFFETGDFMKNLLQTKYIDWQYEEEYRMHREKEDSYPFKPQSLTEIIFGCGACDDMKADIINAVKKSSVLAHVKFYQAQIKTEEYGLDINEFDEREFLFEYQKKLQKRTGYTPMRRLYYYPSAKGKGYGNPYSQNYKNAMGKYFEVVEKVGMQAGASFCLLCHSFFADIYILNWIESISSHRFSVIQYLVACLSLRIIKLRGKEIVWMLHNIHPHKGADKYSESIMSYLYEHADLIISHSKETTEYAKGKAKGRVEYICHPVAPIAIPNEWTGKVELCDVLIWGDILPYKGVSELLSNTQVRESGFKILVVGKCRDAKLRESINACCNDNIRYENRRASYTELKALMSKAKYVLFPYLSGSVSSSGALMDTIVLGGTPVGPNLGAFKDLAEEGVCLVYDDYAGLSDILSNDRTIDDVKREDFIAQNTWDLFAKKLDKILSVKK